MTTKIRLLVVTGIIIAGFWALSYLKSGSSPYLSAVQRRALIEPDRYRADSLNVETRKFDQKKGTEAQALHTADMSVSCSVANDQDSAKGDLRASHVNKIALQFSITDNALARKGRYRIHLLLTDNQNNPIGSDSTKTFIAIDDRLPYTAAFDVDFANDSRKYRFEWISPIAFAPGTYHAALYANGFFMGPRKTFDVQK